MTTTDYLNYTCIPEADLDVAFTSGKYAVVPQTCITPDQPRTLATLEGATGRPATYNEWATYNYKWFTVNMPDKVLFVEKPLPLADVPLPGSSLLLILALSAIIGMTLVRRKP